MMIADIQKIELLRWKFTELGKSIRDLSDQNDEYFNGTLESLKSGFGDVVEVLSGGVSADVEEKLDAHAFAAAELSKVYSDFVTRSMSSLSSFDSAIDTSSKTFSTVSKRVEELLNQVPVGNTQKKEAKTVTMLSQMKKWSNKHGVTKHINKAFSMTHIPKVGMLAGGSIGLMLEGFLRQDKLRKEAGEVYNILIESFDLATKNMVQKGTDIIATLQTKLRDFYGIAKEETQAVAKQFISGGIGSEMFKNAGVDFDSEESGSIGNSILVFSLGLDKMFSLSGGTSAQRMVSMMEDYGVSLDEAKDTTYDLMMAGRESGIGTMQFVKNVETAAGALKALGVHMGDVIELSKDLQKGFEAMGVPKNFAGKNAALGLQSITQAMGSMSKDMTIVIAERMGYGSGISGRQAFLDNAARIMRDGDPGEVAKFIDTVVTLAEDISGTEDEVQVRDVLERLSLGLTYEGARAAYMIHHAKKTGDDKKAKALSSDSKKVFKGAFMTERKAQSAFERELTRVTTGMADVGSAMLGILVNILAVLMNIGEWVKAWISGKSTDEASARWDRSLAGVKRNLENLFTSTKQVGSGLANIGMDFLNPNGQNPLGAAFGDIGSAASAPTVPAQTGYPSEQMVKTIPIWVKPDAVKSGKQKQYKVLGNAQTTSGGAVDIAPWVGGGLSLDMQNVDDAGNIHFEVVGNCPRCGLLFGNAPAVEKNIAKKEKSANLGRTNTGSSKATNAKPAPQMVDRSKPAPWVDVSASQLGVAETPGVEVNPEISKYFDSTRAGGGDENTPWCAAEASWALEQAGYDSPKTAGSGTVKKWGRAADGPEYGALAVTKSGHTSMVVGADDDYVYLLGGNQNAVGKDEFGELNSVGIMATKRSSIDTYRMPENYKSTSADVEALKSNPVLDKWKESRRKKGGSAVIARR